VLRDFDFMAQLRVLWRHPLHIRAALLFGAGGAFVYSYGPLHRAERWQIGHLEQRVDEQNRTLRETTEELERLRQSAATQPDPKAVAAQREKATVARQELAAAKDANERAERTIENLRRSVSQWKARYEKASAELESMRAAMVDEPDYVPQAAPEDESEADPEPPAGPDYGQVP